MSGAYDVMRTDDADGRLIVAEIVWSNADGECGVEQVTTERALTEMCEQCDTLGFTYTGVE